MANEIMYYGGMITAIVFGVLAVILFFALHIYSVIGDFTGITAKRRIRKLKDEGSGRAKSKLSAIRNNTSNILVRHNKTTSKLDKNQVAEKETHKLFKNREKIQNKNANETMVLQRNEAETTVLQSAKNDTMVLQCDKNKTAVLGSDEQVYFEIEQDIVITHSDEKIN